MEGAVIFQDAALARPGFFLCLCAPPRATTAGSPASSRSIATTACRRVPPAPAPPHKPKPAACQPFKPPASPPPPRSGAP